MLRRKRKRASSTEGAEYDSRFGKCLVPFRSFIISIGRRDSCFFENINDFLQIPGMLNGK